MKSIIAIGVGVLAVSTGALVLAQAPADPIATAVSAAPANQREGATVIKWKPDYTYETLRKGTNRLVCYDRSGEPGRAAFAVQCTGIGNLERAAQNRKFESIADKAERQKALDAAEANGTRVKSEYGLAWYMSKGHWTLRPRRSTWSR